MVVLTVKQLHLVGDLKRGRTVRSLSALLTNYKDVNIQFVSPDAFRIEDDLRTKLTNSGISFTETDHLEDALKHQMLYI